MCGWDAGWFILRQNYFLSVTCETTHYLSKIQLVGQAFQKEEIARKKRIMGHKQVWNLAGSVSLDFKAPELSCLAWYSVLWAQQVTAWVGSWLCTLELRWWLYLHKEKALPSGLFFPFLKRVTHDHSWIYLSGHFLTLEFQKPNSLSSFPLTYIPSV